LRSEACDLASIAVAHLPWFAIRVLPLTKLSKANRGLVVAAKTLDLHIVAQVPEDPRPLGIGFKKNQPALLAAVNAALVTMQRDGSMSQLKKKWGVP